MTPGCSSALVFLGNMAGVRAGRPPSGVALRCRAYLQGSKSSKDDIAKEAILANPEAAAELFRDPKRLQRLLEENPALISVLKSRLGR